MEVADVAGLSSDSSTFDISNVYEPGASTSTATGRRPSVLFINYMFLLSFYCLLMHDLIQCLTEVIEIIVIYLLHSRCNK